MASIIVAFFVLFFAYRDVEALKYTDCGSVKGKINSASMVPPCGDVCVLPSGTNVTFNLNFESMEVANDVRTVIHGVIGGIPVPFPIPDPDACQGSGLHCPLAQGTSYAYSKQLEVKKEYPRISLTVKWELKDENGKDIVCMLIPSKIQ